MKLVQFPRSHFRSRLRLLIASAWLLVYLLSLSALIAAEPLAKGIQDNSFFIEEAYNQEPGVVQHIFNLAIDFTNGSREIAPSFTQEWPVFSQTHQFSYTIPYLFTEDDNGMEDIRLNYRLQAFMEDKYTPAFAPRLSLVLPTGDSDKGFGTGVVGYEFNLPFSKIVSDRWTLNFNAGMSVFPNAHQSRHLTNYNVGASAIYAVSRDFNLMLETLAAGTKTLPKACSHSRRLLSAARLRSFLLACVTPSTCLTTRNSSSARLCPSVSPQVPPIGACSFTAHSNMPSCEPKLAQQNDKRCLAMAIMQR